MILTIKSYYIINKKFKANSENRRKKFVKHLESFGNVNQKMINKGIKGVQHA